MNRPRPLRDTPCTWKVPVEQIEIATEREQLAAVERTT